MEENVGWDLWELDRHHGERWESRFQKTLKDPTLFEISSTPSGWAVFRDGYKPMWEDEQNVGRLTIRYFVAYEIFKIIQSFFNLLVGDLHVSGIIYTRSKNLALWVNTSDTNILNELKTKFSNVCSRDENECEWDDFQRSKLENSHMRDIIWKHGQLSAETKTMEHLSVYDIDIVKASPNFIINYKDDFPVKFAECYLIETEFWSPFNSNSLKQFVDSCFLWFQKSRDHQILRISKAIALKIVNNKITVRLYTDHLGCCNRLDVKYANFQEVLILFAQKWKSQLLTNFLPLNSDLKIKGLKESDRKLQFTI